MLIIKPIQDKTYQEEVCEKCGFNFSPLTFAYSEKENDELIAACQFDILGKTATINDFGMVVGKEDDIEALIILGRAVLNFMELSGAKTCRFISQSPKAHYYAKSIGFIENNSVWEINLEGLFDGKCSHKCQ